jgi:hypothetical protein
MAGILLEPGDKASITLRGANRDWLRSDAVDPLNYIWLDEAPIYGTPIGGEGAIVISSAALLDKADRSDITNSTIVGIVKVYARKPCSMTLKFGPSRDDVRDSIDIRVV